jgi:predicted RNA-binding protein (virulence factor B family)
MVAVGRINRLNIKKMRDYGVHLDGGETGDILLPKKYVPQNSRPGDAVEVFVYNDREGHLRATTQEPNATVGRFASLRVVANAPSGAYLDWGVPKDLLVPRSEQRQKMEEGKSYVVFVFLDAKTGRITASSKIDKFIDLKPPNYEAGEAVDLLICDKTDLGYKVIVNNAHWGMVFENEVFQRLQIGQALKGYIKLVREDLKIDVSLQPSGYQRVDPVSQAILKTIQERGGRIEVTDKSPPKKIYSLFGVSKKTFKKAIGNLYKKRLIDMDPKGITIKRKSR